MAQLLAPGTRRSSQMQRMVTRATKDGLGHLSEEKVVGNIMERLAPGHRGQLVLQPCLFPLAVLAWAGRLLITGGDEFFRQGDRVLEQVEGQMGQSGHAGAE